MHVLFSPASKWFDEVNVKKNDLLPKDIRRNEIFIPWLKYGQLGFFRLASAAFE